MAVPDWSCLGTASRAMPPLVDRGRHHSPLPILRLHDTAVRHVQVKNVSKQHMRCRSPTQSCFLQVYLSTPVSRASRFPGRAETPRLRSEPLAGAAASGAGEATIESLQGVVALFRTHGEVLKLYKMRNLGQKGVCHLL